MKNWLYNSNAEVKLNRVKINACCLFICYMIGFSCTSESKLKEEASSSPVSIPPTDEQLVEIGLQKLGQWTDFWRSKGADFRTFGLVKEYDYEPLEWPGENALTEDNPLREHQIPHPGSDGVVDIYGYKIVLDENQRVSYNPDSEVIYYKSNGMRERLLFIGPSGGFEDATWLSEDILLVAGHLQKENGFVPVLWLVKPYENKYIIFETSFASQSYIPENYLQLKLQDLDFSL